MLELNLREKKSNWKYGIDWAKRWLLGTPFHNILFNLNDGHSALVTPFYLFFIFNNNNNNNIVESHNVVWVSWLIIIKE